MRDLQGRRKWKRFFRSNAFAVFLAVISFFFLRNAWDVYKKNEMARISKEEVFNKLSALEAKKKTLEFEVNRLKTDRGVEEELRKRFQVTRPGERVLIIIDKNEENSVANLGEQTILQKIWSGLINLLELN